MNDISVAELIEWAYDIMPFQLDGPSWARYTRFDISAKAEVPASLPEMRRMAQALLADRFGLQAHGEKREMQVMGLVVASGGPKLRESGEDGASTTEPETGKPLVRFRRTSMRELAAKISQSIGRPVIDLTGLRGTYDFTLDATKLMPPPASGEGYDRADMDYLVRRALEDELGLKIESRKVLVEKLMVDKLSKTPSEN